MPGDLFEQACVSHAEVNTRGPLATRLRAWQQNRRLGGQGQETSTDPERVAAQFRGEFDATMSQRCNGRQVQSTEPQKPRPALSARSRPVIAPYPVIAPPPRHCEERSNPSAIAQRHGLPRRCAPRNDGRGRHCAPAPSLRGTKQSIGLRTTTWVQWKSRLSTLSSPSQPLRS
jgi:hypothetical protein